MNARPPFGIVNSLKKHLRKYFFKLQKHQIAQKLGLYWASSSKASIILS